VRISRDLSLPRHHESVPLKTPYRVLGWVIGILGIAGGFLTAGLVEGEPAEIAGSLLVVLGTVSAVGVVRCQSYETTIGSSRIDLESGPVRNTVPSGAVESAVPGPATGWRKLFADQEIVLSVNIGAGRAVFPSRDPDAVLVAIREVSEIQDEVEPRSE
jgi:hypothetical protein